MGRCINRGVGDVYDNALAESMIGQFKTQAMTKGNPFNTGPFKTIDDVEFATMEWVDWFNASRLHSRLGNFSPGPTPACLRSESGDLGQARHTKVALPRSK
jgi:transposase InsO family protein